MDRQLTGQCRRTMLSEVIKERKYQSRAFLILPMSFNIAGILGPSQFYPQIPLIQSCC